MSHELLIATRNAGKVKEFRSLLSSKYECVAPSDPQFVHIPFFDVVENGDSYFENALKKAVAFRKTYGISALADDSGLEVDALEGRPGVFSARFGGETLSWAERWNCLHAHLAKVPEKQWTARFRCVLCYYDGVHVPLFFQATCEGRILKKPSGHEGFGYDPIFFSLDLNKSFGEATAIEKASVSHRARALREFLSGRTTFA